MRFKPQTFLLWGKNDIQCIAGASAWWSPGCCFAYFTQPLDELGAKFVKICEDNKNYSGHKYLSSFVMNLWMDVS